MDPRDLLQRRPRRAVRITATVHRTSGAPAAAEVLDQSQQGCSAVIDLPIGEWLEVELTGAGRRRAQVRWSFGGRSGLLFDEPLTDDPAP